MTEENCILHYKGPVNTEVLTQQRMQTFSDTAIPNKLEKKLFMVLVELGQNIGKYSLEQSAEPKCGIGEITIFKEGGGFTFTAKNLAKQASATQVINRCNQLNTLERNMLRTLRKEIMKMPFNPHHVGAKLGLIQVCLYSNKPIEAKFEETSTEGIGYLSIKVQVG